MTLTQRSPFDPTWMRINLTSVQDVMVSTYKIHELPPSTLTNSANPCMQTGAVFNPSNIQDDQGAMQTVNQCLLHICGTVQYGNVDFML